jgi:hypothetical protein
MFTKKNADRRAAGRQLSECCNCTDRELDAISGVDEGAVGSPKENGALLPNFG